MPGKGKGRGKAKGKAGAQGRGRGVEQRENSAAWGARALLPKLRSIHERVSGGSEEPREAKGLRAILAECNRLADAVLAQL